MIFRVIDLVVGINAAISIAGLMALRYRKKRRRDSIEHLRELELENREYDEFIEREKKRRSPWQS